MRVNTEARGGVGRAAAVAAIAGVVAAVLFELLMEWLIVDPETALSKVYVLLGCLALFALPVLLTSVSLWRAGRRAVIARAFPPPGTLLLRELEPVSGEAARKRGQALQVLALSAAGFSVAPPLLMWALLGMALSA